MKRIRAIVARADPMRAARAFAVANIAFLGVDIALAHAANDFAHRAEWAPIVFSAVATVLLVPGAVRAESAAARALDSLVAWASIVVGVAGMMLHLESAFFEEQTLRDLVYSAPFAGPLAYVGVGLLILLTRSGEARARSFGRWVILLALGGFVGNFALSLLDHAQNDFFRPAEWIGVGAAAYAVGFLFVALVRPRASALVRACHGVMAAQVVVGVVGLGWHVAADLARPETSMLDRFLFGAPAFAPLLFADLAVLAAIGLWATAREGVDQTS
jgi:hypothetical protein